MSAPALAGLVLFLLVPFLMAVGLSFTNFRLNSPLPVRWIGGANYVRMLEDEGFRRAILNNLLFAAVVVPLQTALALILALLVNQRFRGMVFFRTVFFLPVIYPMALVSVVWALIFAPGPTGLMNNLLHGITGGAWDMGTDALRHPQLALPAIMVMSIWQGVGFQMVVMLAGLQDDSGRALRSGGDRPGGSVAAVLARHAPADAQHDPVCGVGDDHSGFSSFRPGVDSDPGWAAQCHDHGDV